MNWNILLASGIEIKWDSTSSVNESRKALKYNGVHTCLNKKYKGESSSKAKYNI